MITDENGAGQWELETMSPVTGEDFRDEVLDSSLPVFACFTTQPCESCFPLCLLARELAEEYRGKIKFVTIDAGEEADLADRYHVLSVPEVILFRDSRPAKRLLGFHYKSVLRNILDDATESGG
jgi:thioredoxin 1